MIINNWWRLHDKVANVDLHEWMLHMWGDWKVHQCSAWNFTNQFVKVQQFSHQQRHRVVLLTIINVLLLIKLFRAGGRLCKVCNFYQKLTLVSFSHVGDCSFKPSVTTKVAPGNTWFPNDHTWLYLLFEFRCVSVQYVLSMVHGAAAQSGHRGGLMTMRLLVGPLAVFSSGLSEDV